METQNYLVSMRDGQGMVKAQIISATSVGEAIVEMLRLYPTYANGGHLQIMASLKEDF